MLGQVPTAPLPPLPQRVAPQQPDATTMAAMQLASLVARWKGIVDNLQTWNLDNNNNNKNTYIIYIYMKRIYNIYIYMKHNHLAGVVFGA